MNKAVQQYKAVQLGGHSPHRLVATTGCHQQTPSVRQQEVQLLVVAALATTMIPVNKHSQQKYSIASAA